MRFTCAFLQVFHQVDELLPVNTDIPLDDVLACALLLYFGINTLRVSCQLFGNGPFQDIRLA
jgi:hypothetical protein